MKACPACGQKVGVDKLKAHIKRVHPREKVQVLLDKNEREEAKKAKAPYKPPASSRGKWLLPVSLLLIVIIILAWVYWPRASGPPVGGEAWGFTLPEATSTPPGKLWNLGQHVSEGKPILLEFMHPQCPSCQEFSPTLATVYNAYGSRIQMVSIVIYFDGHNWNRPSASIALDFAQSHSTPWTYLYDTDSNTVRDLYHIMYMPTVYIIGTDGNIAKKFEGAPTLADLEAAIRQVL